MTGGKLTTICFMGTEQHKALLKQWAKTEDRTVSATLRRIIEREAQRRKAQEKVREKEAEG